MTEKNERWYYLERARVSLERAQQAIDPSIAGIHMELHDRYVELASEQLAPRQGVYVVARPG